MRILRAILRPSQGAAAPSSTPPTAPKGNSPYVLGGSTDLDVVGESHYQENLRQVVGSTETKIRFPTVAVLCPEADNHYDPNAISVWVDGLEVGYVSREDALRYRPGLEALERRYSRPIALHAVITGEPMLGVFMRHDPRDFGVDVAPAPRPHAGLRRTGLSDALATDDADDSYDLDWMEALPYDTAERIRRLRELLGNARDALDRHFMFDELEAALYRTRNALPGALGEYDEACRQHDAEMDVLRTAFLAKWGRVPLLQTYRQMCIRCQKAADLGQAAWWAERGIAVYGADAGRPEAVSDLQERLVQLRLRQEPRPAATRRPRNEARAVRPLVVETLTCARCGIAFERTRVRGRKPKLCPTCREASTGID